MLHPEQFLLVAWSTCVYRLFIQCFVWPNDWSVTDFLRFLGLKCEYIGAYEEQIPWCKDSDYSREILEGYKLWTNVLDVSLWNIVIKYETLILLFLQRKLKLPLVSLRLKCF